MSGKLNDLARLLGEGACCQKRSQLQGGEGDMPSAALSAWMPARMRCTVLFCLGMLKLALLPGNFIAALRQAPQIARPQRAASKLARQAGDTCSHVPAFSRSFLFPLLLPSYLASFPTYTLPGFALLSFTSCFVCLLFRSSHVCSIFLSFT